VCYASKTRNNKHIFSVGTDTYLSPLAHRHENVKILLLGTSPQFLGMVQVRGRLWYPAKFRHRHNVSVGTVTLSHLDDEQCAFQFWRIGGPDTSPAPMGG